MTNATPRQSRRDGRQLAYGALLFFTVLVAVVTFVLSFSGLNDYGDRVAGAGDLAWLVPLGVDGLTLCAVAATFLCRDGRLRVRLYAWIVFAVAVGCSVAGNLAHATARHLSWQGSIGAAAWPILLALASHLVIVVRRHMDPASDDTTRDIRVRSGAEPSFVASVAAPTAVIDPPRQQNGFAGDTSTAAAVATERPVETTDPPRATRTPRAPRPAVPGRDNDLTRQKARDMYRRGTTDLGLIAERLRVSKRSVERYTTDLRQTSAADATDDEERRPGALLNEVTA